MVTISKKLNLKQTVLKEIKQHKNLSTKHTIIGFIISFCIMILSFI